MPVPDPRGNGAVQLVVTDLDGTLSDAAERIHPASVRAIRDLETAGIPVLVATGRRLRMASLVLEAGGLTRPAAGPGSAPRHGPGGGPGRRPRARPARRPGVPPGRLPAGGGAAGAGRLRRRRAQPVRLRRPARGRPGGGPAPLDPPRPPGP